MECSFLHTGRLFVGRSILYRKSLSSCITPLSASSDHFCAIHIQDSSGLLFLMVSIYMPAQSALFSTIPNTYILLVNWKVNGIFLIGDFNVDFDHFRMFNNFSV